jgi:hypothetical protein
MIANTRMSKPYRVDEVGMVPHRRPWSNSGRAPNCKVGVIGIIADKQDSRRAPHDCSAGRLQLEVEFAKL